MSHPDSPLAQLLTWQDLDQAHLRELIRMARDEDLAGTGFVNAPQSPADVTTSNFPIATNPGRADLKVREPLTVSGLLLAPLILQAYGNGSLKPYVQDGETVPEGTILGMVEGKPDSLLASERILLNFLQHLSGIATNTATFVKALGDSSTRLLDTRKTTPGYRALEKYAVACGGGWNHRLGLWDRILIKDNHLGAFPSHNGDVLRQAVQLAREKNPDMVVEVEVDHLDQIPTVLDAGADCLLLDNFTPTQIQKAIALVDGRAATEASGGITLNTIGDFAHLGLDFISTGALVHQSNWVDIGLDWK